MYNMSLVHLRIKPGQTCQYMHTGNPTKTLTGSQIVIEVMCTDLIYCLLRLVHFHEHRIFSRLPLYLVYRCDLLLYLHICILGSIRGNVCSSTIRVQVKMTFL